MSNAFTFDASACTGCKACQEACKDKNSLPVGLLWRRVIEISGGEWHPAGNAWENNVFAYNLSLACNHCSHPKCAGVCPTDAYTVRPDGIVLIDSSRCMGCDYCSWACPYGALQYDAKNGIMTKCNFCYDYLDAGLPPSCVAACPLRALDYGTTEGLRTTDHGWNLWQLPASEHPFPLPDYSRTEPHLVIKPHAGMNYPLVKTVANHEELQPSQMIEKIHRIAAFRELPLVGFTLLTQMAAGMAIYSLGVTTLPLPVLLTIGALLGIGGVVSFMHLGRKRNAWRAVIHLKKSWLSREVLMTGLFGIAWAVTAMLQWFWKASISPWPLAILGIGLIYSMARVYHLRAVAAWNSWHTPVTFFLSAAVLGGLGVRITVPDFGWTILAGVAMVAELAIMFTLQPGAQDAAGRLRIALLGFGIIGILFIAIEPKSIGAWLVIPVFLIALVAEGIGRWQFYAKRTPFPMHSNSQL